MTSNSDHLVVVLGMHRSGTSALSRSLQVLGVSLGENLMPAHADINAKGFWEDNDVVNLNIEISRALGRAWHSVAPITADDLNILSDTDLAERALALVNKRLSAHPVFGLKDPRLANLASFWLPVFRKTSAKISTVLSIRHPSSVAQSLVKRDDFTTEHGYLLWIDHVLASLQGSVGENRVLVDYDLLMEDPQKQLQRISGQLGLPIIESELKVFEEEFLDSGLRHTAFKLSDLDADPLCPAIVRDCYQLLLEAANGRVDIESTAFKDQINSWQIECDRNLPMLRLLDDRWREVATMERHLETHRARIRDLHTSFRQSEANVARANTTNAGLDAEIQRLNAGTQRLNAEVNSVKSARAALEARTHELVDQLGRTKTDLVNQHAYNSHLTSIVNSKERQLIELRNSTSWRVTAPIRWLRELVSRR